MKPFLLLLLLFLLLPAQALMSDCPRDCSCPDELSIFCLQRHSPYVPLGVPTPTKNLYLFQNGISALSQDDFTGLSGLEMLDLSQNQLTEIPDRSFELLSSLHNLDISSNLITHISQESFTGLRLLQRLYLHGNHIRSIHPEAFEGLDHLLELKLQGNQLMGLPTLRLPRLLLLDLSYNEGLPPPEPADLQTPNLEALKMAGLGISELDGDLLQSLGNLHELDLSKNQLKEVPAAFGEAGQGLTRLSLAGNPIPLPGPRPEDLQNLRGLQDLDLSSVNMPGLSESFRHLFPRLRQLTVAENPFNCVCPLAWVPEWLREGQVQLGRSEETRCHFPPLNAGKVLARLQRINFGCPITTPAPASKTRDTTPLPHQPNILNPPPGPTLPPSHPQSSALPQLSGSPYLKEDGHKLPSPPASPGSSSQEDMDPVHHICPSNICLNGGTCLLDAQGDLQCSCSRGTSGPYCETQLEHPPSPPPPQILPRDPPVAIEPDLGSRHVTSTSILLDLQRFIQKRPYLRGIRLTFRNLSGPDRRPVELSVPASYPEYTLRGLRPNSTYSICAGPLGPLPSDGTGSVADRSCTEARTAAQPHRNPHPTSRPKILGSTPPYLVPEPQVKDGRLSTALTPALAAALTVAAALAIAAGTIYYLRCRQAKQGNSDHCSQEASPIELEGIKASLDNGTLPQKQPEIKVASPWNGEYEVPLMQTHCSTNNNQTSLKPTYF